MIFGRNDTIERDLERIRRANMNPDQLTALESREARERAEFEEDKPDSKDIFAMTVAVLSIIAPYAAVFVALLLAFGFVFGI